MNKPGKRAFIFLAALVAAFSFYKAGANSSNQPAGSQNIISAVTAVQLDPFVSGLTDPLYLTSARDGSNRLFIIERAGLIKVLQPGAASPTVFLNISDKVLSGGEQGLLGLAFHPQFHLNRRFFLNYTRRPDGATVISEFRASASNPNSALSSETVLLVIPQPFTNHNGGMIEFGPDGLFYIATGDGGSANDPGNRAQNIDELLGKILRIDVDRTSGGLAYGLPADNPFAGATAGRDEIYALGLRNPWRFSFDRVTGQLYAGDVGQGAIEEVDIITRGGNYGWRVLEGTRCTGLGPASCTAPGFIPPLTEYSHTGGRCSITGGYVYRGSISTLPAGTYVYGDFCTGEIFIYNGTQQLLLDTTINISSFGEDELGELYVVGLGGTIHRMSNPAAACVSAINPASREFPISGGNGSVALAMPPGCNWTAESEASWITITSNTSGSGSTALLYSVAANQTPFTRTGRLTVAGKSFTVIQSADTDLDSLPDVVEAAEGTNPGVKDNDVFGSARLFVMQQYRDFLSREADAGGISYWTGVMGQGVGRAQVIDNFFNSSEFQGSIAPIARLYFSYFQRPADYAGLSHWREQHRSGVTLASISESFAESAEFQQRYGTLTNREFVRLVYENVLGRVPAAAEIDYWAGHLDAGRTTRGRVMLGFSESDEYKARIYNEVYVTMIYAGMLRRGPDIGGFNFWVSAMDQGASGLQLIGGFLGSNEYRNRFLPTN